MLYALGNHRAHGVALLVAVAVAALSSPVLAQWSANDSYRLNQIYLQLGGDYNSSHSIHSDLVQVLSLQRGVFNVSSNTYELLDQFFDEFRDVLSPDGQGGYDAVNIDFNLDGYLPYVHRRLPYDPRTSAELLVTNRAETYWLEKIYNAIQYNGGSGGYSVNTPEGVLVYPDYDSAYYSIVEKLLSGTEDEYANLFQFFSLGQSLSFMYLSVLDWLALPDNLRDSLTEYESHVLPYDINTWGLDFLDSVGQSFNYLYGTKQLREYFELSGLDVDFFNPTNFFTADGSIDNTDNAFTNTDTSVFSKFATSFLPSGLFDPDAVNTDLFEYVDSDIIETPSFNPPNLSGGGLRSSSADSFDYDFDDSSGEYDYNLINPLKTATDKVQHDTDLDNKFDRLAGLVNERITSIFQNPLNRISSQPSRWQASLIDKDMNQTEDYVDPQYSKSLDGVQFVCWCCETMMFFSFFCFCVRRSLNVQSGRDVSSTI